ncbi:alpha/beta hydrolase [Curtobacterium flaccumfaciens]|nr:alpha/beta hydrolase [Curtobacterium flaccumfaciens]
MHGRGVTRAETIRAVPVFRAAGYSVVLASWRNDGVAPRSVDGRYGLGSTEWEDIDAVLRWIAGDGATSVVLMGWSMGGAVVLQTLLRSRFAHLVDGVVLESPVVDWHAVLKSQSQLLHLPKPVRKVAQRLLRTPVLHRLTGLRQPVDLRELDMVSRADELHVPILLLHSDDDGFVPSSASHELARARPDLVRLEVQRTARHTKLLEPRRRLVRRAHPRLAHRGGPAGRRGERAVDATAGRTGGAVPAGTAPPVRSWLVPATDSAGSVGTGVARRWRAATAPACAPAVAPGRASRPCRGSAAG